MAENVNNISRSFADNVNYLAELDNQYYKTGFIKRNGINIDGSIHRGIVKLNVFDLASKEHKNTEIYSADINGNNDLINFFNNMKNTIIGLYPDVSINVSIVDGTNIIPDKNIDIQISSTNTIFGQITVSIHTYVGLDVADYAKYTLTSGSENYIAVLPYLSQLDDSFNNAILSIGENSSEIVNVSNNINSVTTVSSSINNVNTNALNIDSINTNANNIDNINNLGGRAEDIDSIVSNVIPNLSEILLADNNATIATEKALEASVSADSALAYKEESYLNSTNSLTNATNAAVSEANALNYKNSASLSESNALTYSNLAQASEVNSQLHSASALTSANNAYNSEVASAENANIASLKATEASTSALNALSSENTSVAKANEASISAANASLSEINAFNSANSADLSEANALAHKNSALASSQSASDSETSASISAASALSSANSATSSAAIATTKASEALSSSDSAATSSANALISENKAEKWASEAEDVQVEPGKYSAMHWAAKAQSFVFGSAETVSYNNDISGLTSTNVKYAIDELDANIDLLGINKVDKIAGKGLSTEDYTTAEKSKLAGIDTNANNYVHPTSGVVASTYRSVTVDANGHITGGANPTTVSGYGLTDVYTKTENNISLALKINNSEKGVANGIASLDANGKVVLTQIPDSVLGQLEYMGTWNLTTFPTATQKGQYWIASVSGNGYAVGDWAVWNGTAFDKVDNTDAVATVAGRTGNVILTKSDVGLGNVDNTADANKNVLSATKLATARTINGVAFNGTANITIADNTKAPLTGAGASGTWGINITGNAASATKLSTTRANYRGTTDSSVVGELMWKNYGNNHTIFDASNSTTPTGVAKNNTNPDIPWRPMYPTLMGYNGSQTYGVRVDSSRYADQATTAQKWNGSSKTVSVSNPSGGVDGDIWFQV